MRAESGALAHTMRLSTSDLVASDSNFSEGGRKIDLSPQIDTEVPTDSRFAIDTPHISHDGNRI